MAVRVTVGVAVVVAGAVGMGVNHAKMLYYNITQVHLQPASGLADGHRQREIADYDGPVDRGEVH